MNGIPQELEKKAHEIILRYPPERRGAALVPVLLEAQKAFGYLSPEAETWVADTLGVTPVRVREVISFYAMMRQKPAGKYHIMFCHNVGCSLRGAESLQAYLEKKLGIKAGGVTEDGLFSLVAVECLGACGWGPVMLVGEEQYFQLTPEKIDRIVSELRRGQLPPGDSPTPLIGNVALPAQEPLK
ncbi:MAG: NAD(P)H-dependent oxidoreductase subunit E [bacterium]